MTKKQEIRCGGCMHYRITWNPAAPHGCAAWEIKSHQLPHLAVYAASGVECQLFRPRKPGETQRRPAGAGNSEMQKGAGGER